MKINKVTLTDYRSHAGEHTFEFTDGINLLLGRNGAGKSSILEALGLAMFNTGNRSSTNDDAVNFLAKSAFINVEFEGIDGIQYIVERKIGSSPNIKLYQKGDKSSRLEGMSAVEKKIKELAGIESNSKNIYENVITAYQNKMTGIFSDIESRRQEVFNQIFDTAIYKKLADGLAKNAEEKYKLFISNNSTLLNDKHAQLMDSVQLKNDLDEAKKAKEKLEKEIKLIINEISELVKSESGLKETKNKIDRISNNIKNNNKLLEKENDSKFETLKRLESSKKALEIVQTNEDAYKSFLLKSDESNSISKEIDKLEQKEKQKQLYEKNLNSNINEQTKLYEKSKSYESNLLEKLEQLEIIKNEIKHLNDVVKTETGLKINIDKDLNIFIKDKEVFDSLNEKLKGNIKSLENQNLIISEKQKVKFDLPEIESNFLNLENNKLELNKKFDLKRELSNQIEILKTRIKDNEEARKKLSTGICPFLKNDCQNLKSGSSAEDFFLTRKNELMKDFETYNSELKKFAELDKLISDNEKKLTLLKKQKDDGLKNEDVIKDYQNKIDLTQKDIEIVELRLFDFLRKYENNILPVFETKNFKEGENFFVSQISGLKEQSQIHNTKIKGYQDILRQKIIEKSNYESNILTLEKSTEENKNTLNILKEKETDLKNQISIIEEIIKSLPDLKKQRLIINQELEKYKNGYDNYIANKKSSEEIQSLNTKLQNLEANIQKIIADNEKLNISLSDLSTEYSESKLEEIQINLKQKKILEIDYTKKISESNVLISRKQDDLERNKKIENDIKDLKQVIKHLEQKLKLTDEFRKNLKIMGKLVAGRLLAKIEHIATENYRRISGRTEQILWKNDESNAYTVYLSDGTNFRKFEQLSGGEQVTVAISLRSAMASILTKANFAIFDEPTNNLDSERKSALAESLQDLLKNLKQAIIVTHDNSFEEMAQNIINLDIR